MDNKSELAHDWIGFTEARERAKALGAVKEGIYWAAAAYQPHTRFSAHWFNADGKEVALWHYNLATFQELHPPREWSQLHLNELEEWENLQ